MWCFFHEERVRVRVRVRLGLGIASLQKNIEANGLPEFDLLRQPL